VGDATGEPPDGLEQPRLLQIVLETSLVGDVAQDDQRAALVTRDDPGLDMQVAHLCAAT
jgi:hypothetical protein